MALRKFPYPYVSALAIACDPDGLRNRDEFLNLARFVNTADETPLGRGLDLETGYGFWLYDACGTCDFTLFRGVCSQPSENAEIIEDLIRSGHLDYIHGYGDFSEGGFERRLAVEALDYLADRGLRVEVWVNHDGTLNTQQIGRLPGQHGDTPGTKAYHADLLLTYGTRFIERHEVVHTVGQNAPCSILDRSKQSMELLKYWLRASEWRGRTIFSNKLMEPLRLGDGRLVYSFKRFIGRRGGLKRGGPKELAKQIAGPVLQELESKRGYMIVYTHLWKDDGLWGGGAATLDALQGLAKEGRDGRIYITTTQKLLIYNLLHDHLLWSADCGENGVDIRIHGTRDEVAGFWIPALKELQGLTFYTPSPDTTRIYVEDREVGGVVRNPPDETGRTSVSIPATRLVFPSKYRS